MPNLWVCINLYNEVQLLPDCIKSARLAFPDCKIVAVDGVYKVFAEQAKIEAAEAITARNGILADSFLRFTSPKSNDGTLELMQHLKVDKVIMPPTNEAGQYVPWENEYIKRSKYFVGSPGDLYFVLDADERVVAGKPLTQEILEQEIAPYDHGCVKLKRDDQTNPYPILRVHKHFDGMKYDGAHHALWVNGCLIRRDALEENAVLKSCYLDHRWKERSEQDRIRHMAKGAYYRKLIDSESQFRTRHHI